MGKYGLALKTMCGAQAKGHMYMYSACVDSYSVGCTIKGQPRQGGYNLSSLLDLYYVN